MIASSIFVALGQLGWKLSLGLLNIHLIYGFGFYGTDALLMMVAYRYGRLSVLQPILSLSYVLSLILGGLFLQENIDVFKILGVFSIILGVIFIARRTE